MDLDFTPLESALKSLKEAVRRSEEAPADDVIRDAVIQRFEYTYELCWKMLKRQLEREVPSPAELDALSFSDLFREAAERGIVREIEPWIEFRHQRNTVAHTYDKKKAESVYQTALKFLPHAVRLHETLRGRAS
ncbi:MAG: nucleotidyltransferase [Omnitrophica bacterium GWA2_52_8]|nr:MAG: nucleotidyltransferase [Omnitrophica bacterium GWA2_52_8]